MTHNWDGAESGDDRPHYGDEWKDEAARFLYCDIDPEPRIRGIMDVSRCRMWLDIETEKDEPDRETIAVLNQRVHELKQYRQAATDGGSGGTDDDGG